ncbi:glycosyltransferase [Flavisolibacter sp. BT320]|nr:glycosyltransferase [Flavisolibacter longurius]
MLPKISIVTPSYNQGVYIEETILSIINQGYSNLELIIIDGGSKDDTVDIIKKYQDKIAYWVSEPDNGQAHAINKGLQLATGEVFNWINSDDILEKDALKTVGDFFQKNNDKNVLCGLTRCFWQDTNETSHEYRMGLKGSVLETITGIEMNQPGTFYRTSAVTTLGGVNESLCYVFDDELWLRYLCAYGLSGIGLTEKRLAQFRLHRNSKSVSEGSAPFRKERHSLYIDIARSAGAFEWLIEKMCTEAHAETYTSKKPWNLQELDTEKYKAQFAANYLHTLYLEGRKKEAKEALKLIVNNDCFVWNRIFTSLRVKLMFS